MIMTLYDESCLGLVVGPEVRDVLERTEHQQGGFR